MKYPSERDGESIGCCKLYDNHIRLSKSGNNRLTKFSSKNAESLNSTPEFFKPSEFLDNC